MRRRHDVALALAVVAAAFALYWPSLDNGFFGDDFALLQRNRHETFASILRNDLFGFRSLYWRPGWHLLFHAADMLFGLSSTAFVATGVFLHGALAAAVLFALRARSGPAPAVAGALLYLTNPAVVEGVVWPSAALNVLPSAAALLVCGLAIARWFESGAARWWWIAFGAFCGSLMFKEAAYQVPLLWAAGWLLLRSAAGRRRPLPRTALLGVPFAAVVGLHYCALNRVEAIEGSLPTAIGPTLANAASFLRDVAPVSGSDTALFACAALAGIAVLAAAKGRLPFLFAWVLAGSFPYVVRGHASRFAVFDAVPWALFAGSLLGVCARRWHRVAAWLAAAALLAHNLAQHRGAQAVYHDYGETCRSVLASCRDLRLYERPALAIDVLPGELRNGFGQMLQLEFGRSPLVREFALLPRPPLVVHLALAPETIAADATFVHYDSKARRFEVVSREQLVKGLVPMPLVSLSTVFAIVPDQAEAARRITAREVDPRKTTLVVGDPGVAAAGPLGRIVDARIQGTVVRVDLDVPAAQLLVICHYFDLALTHSRVLVDGTPVRILQANGVGNAVVVPAGSKRAVVEFVP
jgi:hypothetical protein